jgi:nucleolar protein 12
MSLSSFLLGKRHSKKDTEIDGDLDALFRSSVCLLQTPTLPGVLISVLSVQISTLRTKPSPAPTKTGVKRRGDAVEDAVPAPSKRKKSVNDEAQPSVQLIPGTNEPGPHSKKTKEGKGKGGSKKTTTKEKAPEEIGDEDNAGLEDAYKHKVRTGKQVARGSSRDEEQLNDTSDSEEDASQLVHETMVKSVQRDKTRSRPVHHHVPPNETKEQRDARTIFLGNVPMEVAKSKVCPLSFSPGLTLLTDYQSALKAFKKYILSHVPRAEIESLRFRSVAFQRPTSAAPVPRARDLERTAEWRATKGDEVPAPQPRLGSGDKKKIAFINNEIHEEVDSVTVYVVFAYGADLAPDEAAKGAVAALDNMQYMGHTLRADTIGGGIGDPKRTVFVGSLDFASREEDVRVFFEGLVSAERGPRTAITGDDSDSENEEDTGDPNAHGARLKTWVTRVRIIRDKDTQLGKGFAYVQFTVRLYSYSSSRNLTRLMVPTGK